MVIRTFLINKNQKKKKIREREGEGESRGRLPLTVFKTVLWYNMYSDVKVEFYMFEKIQNQ